jgi:hypothetical protein
MSRNGGNAGVIELVVEGVDRHSEKDWLFETNPVGIMVAELKVFGRVYLHDPHEEEDLLFVARAQCSGGCDAKDTDLAELSDGAS